MRLIENIKLLFAQSYATETVGAALALKTKSAINAVFAVPAKVAVVAMVAVQTFVAELAVINIIAVHTIFVV